MLDRYAVFEVVTDQAVEAMEALRQERWVIETSIFGSAFHVSTEDKPEGRERLRRALKTKGFSVKRIDRIIPSLEDVFVHLIGERTRSGQPAQQGEGGT